jgi:GNAT superfamily N-acetyltransferase
MWRFCHSIPRPVVARASADRRRRRRRHRPTGRWRAGRGAANLDAVPYRFLIVGEDGVQSALRGGLATLLAATLDDGERYLRRAWRTLRPTFRVVALDDEGEPVGQASCFWVPCRPATPLLGLGDVATAPDHRLRGVARTVCALATEEAWRLHASAVLAKTKPLRGVLDELGFEPVTNGRFFYLEGGARTAHPDWMAAVRVQLPPEVELEEGDS